MLIGVNGADTFWFGPDGGDDMVFDFIDVVDRIGFRGIAGVDDFADLRITGELRGGVAGSLVTYGDGQDTIWLRLATTTSLTSADFVFG